MFGRHHELGRKCSMGMGAREERGKGREERKVRGKGTQKQGFCQLGGRETGRKIKECEKRRS